MCSSLTHIRERTEKRRSLFNRFALQSTPKMFENTTVISSTLTSSLSISVFDIPVARVISQLIKSFSVYHEKKSIPLEEDCF